MFESKDFFLAISIPLLNLRTWLYICVDFLGFYTWFLKKLASNIVKDKDNDYNDW